MNGGISMALVMYDGQDFNEVIASGVTIVDFYADWCGPCKMIAPIFAKLADEMTDVKFLKVDTDEHGSIAQGFGISSIPTLLVFKDGNLVDKHVGFMPEPTMKLFIKNASR